MIEKTPDAPPRGTSPLARRWLVVGGVAACLALSVFLFSSLPSNAATGVGDHRPVLWTAGDLTADVAGWLPADSFLNLSGVSQGKARRFLERVEANWRNGYAPMLMEIARFSDPQQQQPILGLLHRKLNTSGLASRDEIWRAIWSKPYEPHPGYAGFKSNLYRGIDPRFASYFDNRREATIRLDEARWGGVVRDGIPPLKNPKMLPAGDAGYLADSDVVFGIEINGDARAYPKRVLAWHEMFKDTVGGVSLCGVYCTLCGMVIPYETTFNGVHHELGTSGFLYRSNKLMYDHATESMWSTTKGVPVIGPLVGKGIKLNTHPVVTTTWGEWRRRHPGTTVLSLETGHRRDYGEGVAYREYFATDRLMFTVPRVPKIRGAAQVADRVGADRSIPDKAIANKAEVLALRFGGADAEPTALLVDFLRANPVYHGEHGGRSYVVLTDATGANRVYATEGRRFANNSPPDRVIQDDTGASWTVMEDRLVGGRGEELPRLSAHRAFWFGWRAAHPETRLIDG